MTSVQFEAATIIDVIKRAHKAAPKVNANTAEYSGLVIDVQPAGPFAIIRATNMDVFYREKVDVTQAEGERAIWRLSSVYLSAVLQTFRSRSGDVIDFTDNGGIVEITQNRKKAKLSKMVTKNYPEWFETDASDAEVVTDLGNAIKLVEWAADTTVPALGVRLTNQAVYATDKYVMARAPIDAPQLANPVTLPVGLFTGLIPQRGDVKVKVIGGQILFMPNANTQIRGATVGEPFPPIEKVMAREGERSFSVAKDEILDLISTSNSMMDETKASYLRLFIGQGQVAGILEQIDDPANGVRDIIDVVGADHAMHEIDFNPVFLRNAITNCPDERLTVEYCTSRVQVIRLTGTSGYSAWVTPVQPPKKGDA